MIRLLKWLIRKMIEIGNTVINVITIGSTTPTKIDWGSDQVWPVGPSTYIVLPNTGTTVLSSASYATISNISASTNSWTVESEDTTWLTVRKTSNTQARFDYTENGIEVRTAYLLFKIDGTTYARYRVRQTGAQVYITLSPTFVQLQDGLATAGTISVSSNTNNWVCSTSSDGFTATKITPSGAKPYVRWTVSDFTGTTTGRTGYIIVSAYGVTSTTQINQPNKVYSFYGLTSTPINLTSAQTSFSISIISRFGQEYTAEPSVSIGYNPVINAQLQAAVSGGSVGQWNYGFSCNQASQTSVTTTSIVFTQPGSQNSLTFVINQQPKHQSQGVDGVKSAATATTYNKEWIFGTVTHNQVSLPVGLSDVNGMVVVSPTSIDSDYYCHFNTLVYQWGPTTTAGTPTAYTLTNQDIQIPAGSTFTSSGRTFNGIQITATSNPAPRLQINQITGFSVYSAP